MGRWCRCTETGRYICQSRGCHKILADKRTYMKHLYLAHEGGNEKRKEKKVDQLIKNYRGVPEVQTSSQICEHCGALITANNMGQHVSLKH